MSERRVVMDANIAFKVLSRGRDDLVERLRPAGPLAETTLHAPRFLFVELFKHKERLVRASRLPEMEVLEALHALVARLEFHDEGLVPLGTWMQGFQLCAPTDEKDTSYVTLALHLDGDLWTEDAESESRASRSRVQSVLRAVMFGRLRRRALAGLRFLPHRLQTAIRAHA